jgi:hypothetical protein
MKKPDFWWFLRAAIDFFRQKPVSEYSRAIPKDRLFS